MSTSHLGEGGKDAVPFNVSDSETTPELKAEPTPGPWHVAEHKEFSRSRIISVVSESSLAICLVDGGGVSNPRVLATVRANAKLLAAAPLLLKAAKAALKYVDNLNEDTPMEMDCTECIQGTVYYTRGTPKPELCWIHQLEKAVKEAS